jgi:hypothetical protein
MVGAACDMMSYLYFVQQILHIPQVVGWGKEVNKVWK